MQKSTIYRKPMGENLFEEELTIDALSQMGNPLEKLASLVDFEMFRPTLEDVLVNKDSRSPIMGGRFLKVRLLQNGSHSNLRINRTPINY